MNKRKFAHLLPAAPGWRCLCVGETGIATEATVIAWANIEDDLATQYDPEPIWESNLFLEPVGIDDPTSPLLEVLSDRRDFVGLMAPEDNIRDWEDEIKRHLELQKKLRKEKEGR